MALYHRKRFRQAIDEQLTKRSADENRTSGKVVCLSRFGGLLNYYYRQAA